MSGFDPREFVFLSETQRYDAFLGLFYSAEPEDAKALEALYADPDPLIPLILLQYLEDLPEKAALLSIIGLIERPNDVVARAAMFAYGRSHFPGKPRLLKQLIFSPVERACRFAVRTLSQAGFTEILPLILRELPERSGAARLEILVALRFLPDRRTVSVLLPLASSPDETTRFLVLQVLVELQACFKPLPISFFLKKAQDPSELVRRTALEALRRFPTKRVAPLILRAALDEASPAEDRARAAAALGSFPSPDFVRPLASLAVSAQAPALRLSAEIALRALPAAALREGLLPLLSEGDAVLRRQAAALSAELLADDVSVRQALLRLWSEASREEALLLVDAMRALPGLEGEQALRVAVKGPPPLSYAAATALAQMRGAGRGRAVLELAEDASLPDLVRQALLDRFARRGPDEAIRERLLPLLLKCLDSDNMNIRYLGVRGLAWYPLENAMPGLLDMLAAGETSGEVARVACLQLVKGMGRDPMPFLRAVAAHPRRERLLARSVHVLSSQGWDVGCSDELLAAVADAPAGLLCDRPAALFAVMIHLLEHGSVGLLRLWPPIGDGERLDLFLRMLASSLRNPRRRFPALALDALVARMKGVPASTRALFYEVLASDGRNKAAERLAAALLREDDAAVGRRGAKLLRRLLTEAPL